MGQNSMKLIHTDCFKRIIMKPAAVEFLIHMSLASAVASVNSLAEDCLIDQDKPGKTRLKPTQSKLSHSEHIPKIEPMIHTQPESQPLSVTGARLDLQWRQLHHVEYLTDGGNSWIHTAILNGRPVVVKTLKPECQDVAMAINEIESELGKYFTINNFQVKIPSLTPGPTRSYQLYMQDLIIAILLN